MKRAIMGAILLVIMMFLLAACAPKEAPASVPQPVATSLGSPQLQVQAAPAKAAWEVEWNRLGAAAKKEGTLVVYSSVGTTLRGSLVKAMRDNFDLSLEFISGKGGLIGEKILTERRAGLYLVDVYIGGASTPNTILKPAGVLDPLEPQIFLPEVLDPKVWYGGELRWVDKDRCLLGVTSYANAPFVINTGLVKPEELKSYRDLLNPKWKGKIFLKDPTGPGAQTFFYIVGGKIMGYDFMREFAKQEPTIIDDDRLQIEWVARGKYAIAIHAKTEITTEFAQAGAPIAQVTPVEGTWATGGSGNLSRVNRAPHPNAAKLFINWLLTKEGQTVFSRALGVPSRRLDVPTEGLDPTLLLKPGLKYVDKDTEEIIEEMNSEKTRKLAVEIFGPLMKK